MVSEESAKRLVTRLEGRDIYSDWYVFGDGPDVLSFQVLDDPVHDRGVPKSFLDHVQLAHDIAWAVETAKPSPTLTNNDESVLER